MKKSSFWLFILAMMSLSCSKDDDSSSSVNQDQEIQILTNTDFGNYLADEEGRTLYIFARDYDGLSRCLEGCESIWIPVGVSSKLPESAQNEFGLVRRDNGFVQLTFRGWPLYTYSKEGNNEISGDNMDGEWYLAKPDYSLFIGIKEIEGVETKFMLNKNGQSVYYKSNDLQNQSSCLTEACLWKYPPLNLQTTIFPSVLDETVIQTTQRPDSLQQTSYKNQPMYIHSLDIRGGTTGQGFLGVWFVMEDAFF
jgi:predicted lipoprotein with Yx(FWY)xxD motif